MHNLRSLLYLLLNPTNAYIMEQREYFVAAEFRGKSSGTVGEM
jgi:hypothetical protein